MGEELIPKPIEEHRDDKDYQRGRQQQKEVGEIVIAQPRVLGGSLGDNRFVCISKYTLKMCNNR